MNQAYRISAQAHCKASPLQRLCKPDCGGV